MFKSVKQYQVYLLVFGLSLEPLFTFSLAYLLWDHTRNFASFLNALLVAFFLHFEIGNERNNVMANILAGFLVIAKFHRFGFLTISFGRTTTDRRGIRRDSECQESKGKDFHFSTGF